MIAADAQKYFTLRIQRGLITDGIGQLGRTHVLGWRVDQVPDQALGCIQGTDLCFYIKVQNQHGPRFVIALVPVESVQRQPPAETGLDTLFG